MHVDPLIHCEHVNSIAFNLGRIAVCSGGIFHVKKEITSSIIFIRTESFLSFFKIDSSCSFWQPDT